MKEYPSLQIKSIDKLPFDRISPEEINRQGPDERIKLRVEALTGGTYYTVSDSDAKDLIDTSSKGFMLNPCKETAMEALEMIYANGGHCALKDDTGMGIIYGSCPCEDLLKRGICSAKLFVRKG